ncbi:TRAP transporter large permease subunit [Pusillimonas sp. ANT_WB101]|uniref:TRAP transporter large permease subunit n=1 Tax=Pusillimonas sp. ANT_WB101 TaxID=2597356 RepID=UPI0011F0030D|nr:TRAP transporter large permease subunit [Pusillimonas sp. ANT_WB101]KAA0890981.1 TRAP transporter large permease subunit [Pusillimonas sp. ANT_WB101]
MTVFVFLGSLLGAMSLGMPIAFALLVCGAAIMLQMGNFESQIIAQKLIDGADNYPLMAIPFFLVAGELMNAGGLSRRIVAAAMALFGHLRGGLGYVVIGTGLLLASLSGSAIADTATLAVMLVPLMREAGYNINRSCGLIAATGIIAPIIPPSVGFILFGVTANLSITKLFMAGIAPGIMMGLSLISVWWWLSRREAFKLPARKSGREVLHALRNAIWAIVLPILIIGGLRFGIFTPTEAGVIAAVYALLVSLLAYRELSIDALYIAVLNAAKTSAVIMFMVAASMVSAWLITVANVPMQVVALLRPFMETPVLLMFLTMLAVLAIGMALDFTPTILILTPVLMPVVKVSGIDPIYFGVIFIMTTAIGLITPPVGAVLNVVCGVSKISMEEAVKGVMPFLIAEIFVLFLFIAFPALVTVPASWFY